MRKYLIFIITLFIVGACSTAPGPDDYEWCWIYDFTTSDYDFSIIEDRGIWIDGTGFNSLVPEINIGEEEEPVIITAPYGALDLYYTYPYDVITLPTVDISHITVSVKRPSYVDPNIPLRVNATGSIYGLEFDTEDGYTDFIIPGGLTEGDFTLQNITGDTSQIIDTSLTIQVNGTTNPSAIVVTRMTIYGSGYLPFFFDACGDPTPTPTPVTSTPTETPSPTPTNTPTETLTPSQTFTPSPTPNPCEIIWDFEVSDYGFELYPASSGAGGEWIEGTGFQSTDIGEADVISFVLHDITTLTGITGVEILVDTSSSVPSSNIEVWIGDPLIDNNPSPTIERWELDTDDGWMLDNGSAASTPVWRTVPLLEDTITPHDITGINLYWIMQDEGFSRIRKLRFICDDIPTPTPSPTSTLSTEEAESTDVALSMTPPATSTPNPSLTYIPSGTPFSTMEAGEGTPTPSDAERENEVESAILDELQRHDNWLENAVGDLSEGIGNTLNGIGEGIANIGNGIGDFFGGIGGILSDALGVVQELVGTVQLGAEGAITLMGKMSGWITDSFQRIAGMITSFFGAPPTAIPGLPMCFSDPLNHDLCAIYYILDWTLLATGTPGQFIVPLVLALMNIVIIFRAIKFILKFIKRSEDATA